jgi:putative ABC transport system permease protein
MSLALMGVVFGLVTSLLLMRLIAGLLFGVSSTDPLTLVSFTALLAAVAFLANYIPASRAARIDPMVALRHE